MKNLEKTITLKKIITLIIILFSFSSAWSKSIVNKDNQTTDPSLVVFNNKKALTIKQGERIFVKIGDQKYNGIFKYATDSSIYIDNVEINLKDVEIIAKSKKGKTIGMFFTQLPVSLIGVVFIGLSIDYGGPLGVIGGAAVIGTGFTGAIFESYRGKRYRAFKKSKKRNWEYIIK